MRLTVGPLPSSVYWRRRAIVLGALFIVLLVLVTTCREPGGSGAAKTGATPDANATVLTPETGAPETEGPASSEPSITATTAAPVDPPVATTAAPAAPSKGDCTDDEIKVTPAPGLTTAPAGQTIVMKLRIKNESDRACNRDVGRDAQEIYIKQGAQVIWSSDRCTTKKGTDVVSLAPKIEHEYQTVWNGRQSTSCADGAAAGPAARPGSYEVFGRLGTDRSSPVSITLT